MPIPAPIAGKTRLRSALRLMGYDTVPQFRIVDGPFVAVVDFLSPSIAVAVEFDGFVKYGRRSPLTLGAQPADVVAAEKVREDHVRRAGLRIRAGDVARSGRHPDAAPAHRCGLQRSARRAG